MSAVRVCDDHGYFEATGEGCPACGAPGRAVLDGDRRRRLSKFLSGALRHFPDDAGLSLDGAGWTPLSEAVATVERKYDWANRDSLAAVVTTDPKGRFERVERDGTELVRAAYGHSVDVDLADTDDPVPDLLYHGTAPESLGAIREEGLRPMNRQQVHLSGTVAEAREVGRRHAPDPVVLEVDAARMLADDHRIARRGRGVYTTDRVPPAYMSIRQSEE